MPDINPQYVPTINPGNMFDKFTTDQSIAIRWLTPHDPVYFEAYNRPLADVRLNQLILAKTIDNFSFNIGYLNSFPFITQPQISNGTSVANVPSELFYDFHISIPFKWYNLRLGKIKRLSGQNLPTGYSGTVRFIFVADENAPGGPIKSIFYVDYLIESDLDLQPVRINIATATTDADLTPINPIEGDSVGGFVIFTTSELNSDSVPESSAVKQFLDLAEFSDSAYVVTDVDGISGGEDDFTSSTIIYGTGVLTANSYNLIPAGAEPGLTLDPTETFFNADNKQIKNIDDPVSPRDAANKNFVDSQVGILNATLLKRDGSNTFTGTSGPLNMSSSRIINLAAPTNGGDATNKSYVDTMVISAIKRDGTVSWLSTASPLDMSGVRIINVGSPVGGVDAANKNYVDNQISNASSTLLKRDGSNTFTGTANNLRMSNKRMVQLADPVDAQDATTKSYVDAAAGIGSGALSRDGSNVFTGEISPLNLTGHRIINLANPTQDADAANKQYIDANFMALDGSTIMAADLNMGSKRITSLASPTLASDAASKQYVDNTTSNYLKKDGSNSWVAESTPLNMSLVRIINVGSPVDTGDAANKVYVDNSVNALQSSFLKLDGSNTFTGTVSDLGIGGKKIVNLGSPTSDTDAATKAYVDTISAANTFRIIGSDIVSTPDSTNTFATINLSAVLSGTSIRKVADTATFFIGSDFGIEFNTDQGILYVVCMPIDIQTASLQRFWFGGGKIIGGGDQISVGFRNEGDGPLRCHVLVMLMGN